MFQTKKEFQEDNSTYDDCLKQLKAFSWIFYQKVDFQSRNYLKDLELLQCLFRLIINKKFCAFSKHP